MPAQQQALDVSNNFLLTPTMSYSLLVIILQAVTILVGLYLAFFKSYFQERGKIVATKKDLKEITSTVATIQSDIGILAHKKMSLATEKQNTLKDCNEKYTAWLKYLMNVSLYGFSEAPDNYFLRLIEKLDQLYYDYTISEARLELFFNTDHELISQKDKMVLKTIELSNNLKEYLNKITVEVKYIATYDTLPDDENKKCNISAHNKKIIETIRESNDKRLELFKLIAPLNLKFLENLSLRINEFEKN